MTMAAEQPDHLIISHIDQLEQIRDEWEEILETSRLKSPFLTIEYLQLWFSCFARPDRARIYRATQDGVTIGYLPLAMKRRGPFRLLTSLTNDHCLFSEPLVRQGAEAAFPKIILDELLKDHHSWDMLEYDFSYSFSDFPGLFGDDLLDRCSLHRYRRSQPTYAQRLDRSFEDYFGSLSRNTRKLVHKKEQRLARAGACRYVLYQGHQAVEHWHRFREIEDAGWKGRAESSIARESDDYQRYYAGLVRLMAELGAVQLYFLELDDRAIAGGLGITVGDTFHFLKSGYDEEFQAYSPSVLLLMHMTEHLTTEFPQIKRIHQFPWSYGYKDRYNFEHATCIDTTVYGPTLRGEEIWMAHLLKVAARHIPGLRPAVRRIRRLTGRSH